MNSPWVRHELVVVLLALALVLPRLSALGTQAVRAEAPDENCQAAVGYARLRLWSEFVRDRESLIASARFLPPTLSEYRQYLSGLGLRRRGDVATLVVLPLFGQDESRLGPQIEVRLAQSHPPLLLKLYVPGVQGRPKPVGQLEIVVDAEDGVSCLAELEEDARWFSAWPVRPTLLLP